MNVVAHGELAGDDRLHRAWFGRHDEGMRYLGFAGDLELAGRACGVWAASSRRVAIVDAYDDDLRGPRACAPSAPDLGRGLIDHLLVVVAGVPGLAHVHIEVVLSALVQPLLEGLFNSEGKPIADGNGCVRRARLDASGGDGFRLKG